MTSNRYSFLKIPQENDVEVTYKICLDDLDLSLLPINQLLNRYNGGKELTLWDVDGSLKAMKEYSRVEDEICKFEVYAQKNEGGYSETNASPKSIFCHLCNLRIPAPFIKNHMDSDKHAYLLKLSNEVLARTRKQLNEILLIENITATETEKDFYCETCNIVIKNNLKENHETEKKHISLIKRDQILGKLFEIYSEDTPENYDSVKKEKIKKSNEKKAINCEKNDSNKTLKQITVDKTQTKTNVNNASNIDLNGTFTLKDPAKTYNKPKNIDSETKAIQKNIEVATYENNLCADLLNKPKKGADGEIKNKDTKMEILKKGHEKVNKENKTDINCLSSNGHKQNIMTNIIITDNKIINQEANINRAQKDSAQMNSKIIIQGQGQNMKTTNETNKVSNFHVCEVCKKNVPNNSDDIRAHNEGRPHKKKQELNINKIQKDSAEINSKVQGKNMKTTNETNKASNFHVCEICKVNVPNNCDAIRAHNKGRHHKRNILNNVKASIDTVTNIIQTPLSKGQTTFLQNVGVTDSINIEGSNSGVIKSKKQQLAKTHKNVVSETEANVNENISKEVKERTSLEANKSQNGLNENKQLVSHKNQKEQPGDTTKQKNINTEIDDIPKDNEATTNVPKRKNNITDDNNSGNRKKQTEQLANARIPTPQNNGLSENKRKENDEIKASSNTAAQNDLFENKPLKHHQNNADTSKTQKNIESEREQTENNGIPMELIQNSKGIREFLYRMNDAEFLRWIVDSFDSLIAVPTISGDVLMVSKLNYHGLKVRKWIHCLICDTDNEIVPCSRFFNEHIASKRHINKLNIKEKNGLRLGRHNTVHCVLCHITIQLTAVTNHLNSERHRELEKKALVNPKDATLLKNHSPNKIITESDVSNETIEENDEDFNNEEPSENETGDYISKLIRKSYYRNDIAAYQLLQLFWTYVVIGAANGDTLKLRYWHFHGIQIIDETDCYSCLLCEKRNKPLSWSSIRDHIENEHKMRKLTQFQDAHGLRQIRRGLVHCALCNVSFRNDSLLAHVFESMHEEVLGKDPEAQIHFEDTNTEQKVFQEPETKTNETNSCAII